ncbi:MAG: hypothetical protein M2R45_03385 [Verrucomicrobia subdivision 3 bacterium]|nr:hypothetical protein [Limisphaerales bacterium]MCS1416702.1 hypothetical protein [Limisphaerales bacterium]
MSAASAIKHAWQSPIVLRELTEYSRRPWTYWTRSLFAFAALGMLVIVTFSEGFALRDGEGFQLIPPLTIVLFLIANIAGIRSTYDTIGRERRQGTLSLMYLTGLQPQAVMIAKLASNGLQNVWAVIAVLPILGIPLLIGGVSGLLYVEIILAILATLWVAMTVGFVKSCEEQNEHLAFSKALRKVFLLNLSPIGPAWLLLHAFLESHILYFTILFFAFSYGLRSWILAQSLFEHAWRNQVDSISLDDSIRNAVATSQKPGRIRRNQQPLHLRSAPQKRATLRRCDTDPAEWIVKRYADTRQVSTRPIGFLFVLLTLIVGGLYSAHELELEDFILPYFMIMAIGKIFFVVALAKIAPQSFGEITANGAIEILQTTPLRIADIIRRVLGNLRRDFLLGGIPFVVADLVVLGLAHHHPSFKENSAKQVLEIFIYHNTLFWPLALATVTVGIWMGIKHRSLARGAYWTIVYVLILPGISILLLNESRFYLTAGILVYSAWWIAYSCLRLFQAKKEPQTLVPPQ